MLRTKLSFKVIGADAKEINKNGWQVISEYYQVNAEKISNDYDIDLTVTIDTSPDGKRFFIGDFLVKPKSFAYNIPQVTITPA